jgi:hypothetical protein
MAKLNTPATYTDAEMLAHFRAALVEAARNQSYTFNGRTFTKADVEKLKDLVDEYERKVSSASRKAKNTALARFNRAV